MGRIIAQSTFPENGLIAFWNLDNANGLSSILADFGNYTLNTYGGYTSVVGKINNAFNFSSSDEGMWTNEQILNLLSNPTSFSISFWLKITDNSSVYTLMGSAFGSMGFHFDYINDDTFYGGTDYGITMNMSTVGGPYAWQRTFAREFASIDTWYHVVGTYDLPSTTMRLYINGILKDTNTNAIIGENALPNVNGFAINGSVLDGYKEYGTNQFYDAIGFWSKALNQNEISNLYNNGNGKQQYTDNKISIKKQNLGGGKLNLKKKYLYKATGTGLIPNINGLRFYDTGGTFYTNKVFYDETNTYMMWISPVGYWFIKALPLNPFTPGPSFGKAFSNSGEPPTGNYVGGNGYIGTVTISSI